MTEEQKLPATYRALVQNVYSEPFTVDDVPTPAVVPGSAILRIERAGIIRTSEKSTMELDSTHIQRHLWQDYLQSDELLRLAQKALEPGVLVFFDGFIRGRDDPSVAMISGLSDVGEPRAQKLMHGEWRNSTYAQYAKVPLENCFPLDEARFCDPVTDGGLGYSFDQLAWIGMPVVGYGGLRRIGVQAGETVIIAPATGGFGGATTMAALAMGARVIAMGRNKQMLNRLAKLSPRVRTVPMTDDHDSLVKALTRDGLADAYLDLSPPAISSGHMKSAVMALRKGGRVSLMGGIGTDLALPMLTIVFNDIELKGQWMYSPADVRDMIKLADSGLLDLSKVEVAGKFSLEKWEQAFDVAAGMRFDQVTVFSEW